MSGICGRGLVGLHFTHVRPETLEYMAHLQALIAALLNGQGAEKTLPQSLPVLLVFISTGIIVFHGKVLYLMSFPQQGGSVGGVKNKKILVGKPAAKMPA